MPTTPPVRVSQFWLEIVTQNTRLLAGNFSDCAESEPEAGGKLQRMAKPHLDRLLRLCGGDMSEPEADTLAPGAPVEKVAKRKPGRPKKIVAAKP